MKRETPFGLADERFLEKIEFGGINLYKENQRDEFQIGFLHGLYHAAIVMYGHHSPEFKILDWLLHLELQNSLTLAFVG